MSEVFIIPRQPLQDEHGFVLLPVMPKGSITGRNCSMCNSGHNCKPDKHHAYWPKPTKSKIKLRKRSLIYGNDLPNISKDPYDQLRSAPFSVSNLICRGWHEALHRLQSPPKHLPDADMVQLALDQHQYITKLADRVVQLSALIQRPPEPVSTIRLGHLVESVRLGVVNFPREIVLPTIGYYCLMADEEYTADQACSAPVTFDYYQPLNDAHISLGRATKMLEALN